MTQLGQSKTELVKTGAAFYALSNEAGPDLKKMRDQHGVDFITFLSDKDGKAARLYSGVYPDKPYLKPGTYVIGKNKKIVYAYTNENFMTRAPTDAVIAALKK